MELFPSKGQQAQSPELMFQPRSRGKEKDDVPAQLLSGRKNSLFPRGGSAFCSSRLIGSGPPTLGRAICFAPSTDLNANLIQNTLTETPRMMSDQMSGHPRAQASTHIALTIQVAAGHDDRPCMPG